MKRLLALLLGAVALAACTRVGTTGEGQRTNPKTIPHFLRYGDLGDLSSLNPLLVSDETLAWLPAMTMAWLARYDHDNKPIPELATVVPTIQNGGVSGDGM